MSDTLINILLFLNVIVPNGSYTVNDINNYATIYSAQINSIETTPGELPPIMEEYESEGLVILDNLGG